MARVPDICVVIAAKDAADTVGQAVASALRQPEVQEVVVVDDGSSDATADAAMRADDGVRRLRVVRLAANAGPSAARNRAIAESRAPLICVLDADDHLIDGRFARMLAQAPPDWDLLADDISLAAAGHAWPHDLLVGLPEGPPQPLDLVAFVRGNMPAPRRPRHELGYLKPLMRREFLARNALAYDETLRLGEDYVLYALALLHGARFFLVAACGYVAVERAGSLSRRHGAAELAALVAAEERLIEAAQGGAPAAAAMLEAHLRGVRLKLDHRRMLDAKARGDWPEVMRRLLRTPATAAYIIGQTIQARTGRRRGPAAEALTSAERAA